MKNFDQDTKFAASTVDEQIDALSGVQDEEQRSSSLNVRMLYDLYQFYDHASYSGQLEHSLERIGQRLEAQRIQHVEAKSMEKQHVEPVKVISTPAQMRSRSQGKRIGITRSPMLSRLASLAAVFFVALLVGSLLLTLLATRRHTSEIVGKSESQIVTIHMGPASFLTSFVILRPGASLRLVNDTPVVHIIDNGYWDDNGQKNLLHEQGMSGFPIRFEAIHETHLLGPLQTPGTYHLFDEIHVEMNLTILVQSPGTPGVISPAPAGIVLQIHLEQQTFQPQTITIHTGTVLALTNDNPPEEHIIMNGYWKDTHAVYIVARGKPIPTQVQRNLQGDPTAKLEYIDGQGVPIVDIVVQPENPVVLIGGFMRTGTYRFFDPVHVGMNLTVVVQ